MSNSLSLNMDAFSDGQIASKLWLCEELESLVPTGHCFDSVWIYGSWYGLLPFLLLSRGQVRLNQLHLFEVDNDALQASRKILDHWRVKNQLDIFFHWADCSDWNSKISGPSLLINTSVEHIENYKWWEPVPSGTMYALQSTNMEHIEHINRSNSIEELEKNIDLAKPPLYRGLREFRYPKLEFQRYMLIGVK
jgi:hypothetical protein